MTGPIAGFPDLWMNKIIIVNYEGTEKAKNKVIIPAINHQDIK
jgi:hypothetical protein